MNQSQSKFLKLLAAALGEKFLFVCRIFHKILKKFVIIALIFVVFFSVWTYFGNNVEDDYTTESALLSNATASTKFKGVFIRDEEVIKYDGQGAVSYRVADGGRLGEGSAIAEIYSSDSQILVNQEIAVLKKELSILQRIQNPGTTESAQPASIASLIEESYRNSTYKRELGNYEAFEEEKENLLINLSTYQIITDSSIDFSARIEEINSQISRLSSSVTLPANTIKSEHSAYFASYSDGYEDMLSKESIDGLTVEMLEGITDSRDDSGTVIGKLIYGYDWYVAGVIDNSKKQYEIGDDVLLQFESNSGKFNAEVIDLKESDDPSKTILIVSCEELNYDLVQHRCENVEIINGEYTGLKVSRDAIRFRDFTETVTDENGVETEVTTSCKCVRVIQGEQVVFKRLDVIFEGNNYVLSAEKNDHNDYLSLYDEIIVEGVD